MKTIDLRPTWSGLLPTLLVLYTEAQGTGRATALEELKRMASIADAYVASQEKPHDHA